MRVHSICALCFDHPDTVNHPGEHFDIPPLVIMDVPDWIQNTNLWKLVTRDLPNNPAKLLVVRDRVTERIIEIENGKTPGAAEMAQAQQELSDELSGNTGEVNVGEDGNIINPDGSVIKPRTGRV